MRVKKSFVVVENGKRYRLFNCRKGKFKEHGFYKMPLR